MGPIDVYGYAGMGYVDHNDNAGDEYPEVSDPAEATPGYWLQQSGMHLVR